MNRMKRAVSLLAIFAVLMLLPNAGGVAAQQGGPVSAQATPVGTAFTYQGQLIGSGTPITSTCDFQFGLWDAATLGALVSGTTTQTVSSPVTNGYFTVSLDFGPGAFDGHARWLGIAVRCPSGSGTYTPLSPLQPLTPAPYALYALNATTATTATTALSAGTAANFTGPLAGDVTGLQGATTVIGLQGKAVAATAPGTNQVLTFNGAQWAPANPSGGGVTSVSASAPLSSTGGTTPTISFTGILPLANGGTGSASQNFVDLTNPQVVGGAKTFTSTAGFTAAGAPFTVTSSSLVANLNADLLDSHHASDFQQHYQNMLVVAKSGGDFTTIGAALASITPTVSATNTYLIYVAPGVYTETVFMWPYVDIEGSGELTTKITQRGSDVWTTGTVVGADNAELRFLTVENTGVYTNATAIFNDSASPRLTHITAAASGATNNTGVVNYSASSPLMTNVSVTASGGQYNLGVWNSSSSPTMTNVTASAWGGANSTNYGVNNFGSSSPTMTNVTSVVSGTSSTNYGLYNYYSSATIHNSAITASGGTSYGIYSTATSGPYTVTVDASQIAGSITISQTAHFTTLVGASLLNGGAVFKSGGTMTCAGVYDENYWFYASTCP